MGKTLMMRAGVCVMTAALATTAMAQPGVATPSTTETRSLGELLNSGFSAGDANALRRASRGDLANAGSAPADVGRGVVANDTCATAIPLPLDIETTIDTTAAATEGFRETNLFGPDGFNLTSDLPAHDIWFDFTAPSNGNVRVQTCLSDFATVIVAHENGCPFADNGGDFAQFDNCGDGIPQTDLTFPVQAGLTYQIRIGGFNFTDAGFPDFADFESGMLVFTATFVEAAAPVCPDSLDEDACQLPSRQDALNSTPGFFVNADDFAVLSASFDGTAEIDNFCAYGTYSDPENPPVDDFTLNIYENNAGELGTLLFSLVQDTDFTLSRVETGVNAVAGANAAEFEFNFALDSEISLPDDVCYFLEIVNNTADQNAAWFWETAPSPLFDNSPVGNDYALSTNVLEEGEPGVYDPACSQRLFLDFAFCISGPDVIVDDSGTVCAVTLNDCEICDGSETPEAEACGDRTNGGCNADPNAFETADCGTVICGTVDNPAGAGNDDEDWYQITVQEETDVTFTITGNFFGELVVADTEAAALDCVTLDFGIFIFPFAANGIAQADLVLPAGTWTFWVQEDADFLFLIDCLDAFEDEDYQLSIDCMMGDPTGACCIDDGFGNIFCLDNQTEADCGAQPGGTYQGDDTTCLGDGDGDGFDDLCVAPASCPCDFDGSGGAPTAIDYFGFLGDFFAGLPSADFDGSGGTPTAIDYFGFLGCLFNPPAECL